MREERYKRSAISLLVMPSAASRATSVSRLDSGDTSDSTVRSADNRRVSGSDTQSRRYTEYWTLIRAAGTHGAPHDPDHCPNCGAALDRVNMAGNCEYCGTHLTRGEFDWVLARIEQDEAYTG